MSDEARQISVPAAHPSLPGHFPGRPIVPGVVILDRVIEDWRRIHPNRPLRGLKKMKFISPLQPDERFLIAWGEDQTGKVSFKAVAGGRVLASGQFVLD